MKKKIEKTIITYISIILVAILLISCRSIPLEVDDNSEVPGNSVPDRPGLEEPSAEMPEIVKSETDFYNAPTTFKVTKNLVDDYNVDNSFVTDDSQQLQQAIDEVNSAGGGKIIIPAGNYSFINIELKTDVHLAMESGVIIRPSNTRKTDKNNALFILGNSLDRVYNTSIIGASNNNRFIIDYVECNKRERLTAVRVKNVENFKLANFTLKDARTAHSCIGLGPELTATKNFACKKGVVKNVTNLNAHYGYGTVQVQAGKEVWFENLYTEGGVALRIETGWDAMNAIRPKSMIPKTDDIYGRDIRCREGQSALLLSPHTIDQGYVDVRDITGWNCEFVIKISKGFLNSKQKDGTFTEGTFSSESIIEDVKAYYGDKAQVRGQLLRFVPCDLRHQIDVFEDPEFDECFLSPALAPVYAPSIATPNEPGSYLIDVNHIQSFDFPDGVPDIITDDTQDYEECSLPYGWVPNAFKNTPRDKDPIKGVIVNQQNIKIGIGVAYQLTSEVIPNHASQRVTWRVKDRDIANITADGVLKGFTEGETVVSALSSDNRYMCTVKVIVCKGCDFKADIKLAEQ